jgi:hypothetical protein
VIQITFHKFEDMLYDFREVKNSSTHWSGKVCILRYNHSSLYIAHAERLTIGNFLVRKVLLSVGSVLIRCILL